MGTSVKYTAREVSKEDLNDFMERSNRDACVLCGRTNTGSVTVPFPTTFKGCTYDFYVHERCVVSSSVAVEVIEKPKHYVAKLNGREYEVADVCEAFDLNLRLGQVVQYILREKHKGGLEDLKKAKRWLGREIAKREGREGWE